MMRRRLCCSWLAWAAVPPAARAQPGQRPARIGVLGGSLGLSNPSTLRVFVEPLRAGLSQHGWIEGRNLTMDWRFAEGRPERLPALLAELVALEPDVLVTIGPRPALLAKQSAGKLPVVALAIDDPVDMGLAPSRTRPGGNVTGLVGAFEGILSRRLQLLKDFVPDAKRFAVLMNPATLQRSMLDNDLPEMARKLGIQILVFEAPRPEDHEAAFAAMVRDRVDGVLVLADASFFAQRMELGRLCLKHRLPSIWGGRDYLEGGGLASFQGDFAELSRRAGALVDKILKGTPPGEMPFEQSTKFELVVNLKGARALGLKVPQSVLVSADEVLE
jgi:putative tryptophan/tyrosine transport system substrate-binding protein